MSKQKEGNTNTDLKTNIRLIEKLSITKTKRLEKRFSATIGKSRATYLSKELNKYKNIKVSYD